MGFFMNSTPRRLKKEIEWSWSDEYRWIFRASHGKARPTLDEWGRADAYRQWHAQRDRSFGCNLSAVETRAASAAPFFGGKNGVYAAPLE